MRVTKLVNWFKINKTNLFYNENNIIIVSEVIFHLLIYFRWKQQY